MSTDDDKPIRVAAPFRPPSKSGRQRSQTQQFWKTRKKDEEASEEKPHDAD
jgi:hypothetical protein